MLRLRFDVQDLARTVFAPPFLLCELSGSIEALQRPASAFQKTWLTTHRRLPLRARALMSLVPAHGGVPEFLAPERDGTLDDLLELVTRTPAAQVAADMAMTRPPSSGADWIQDLTAGRAKAFITLREALRCWHEHVMAPVWPHVQPVVAAELSNRAWHWTTRGAEETLNTLHPQIRWNEGILEVGSPVDADIDLNGRGLRLVPSAVWARPVLALGWEQPSLTYPVPLRGRSRRGMSEDRRDSLDGLIGSTRSRVLRQLAAADHTTSGLASSLGISLASASAHAAALREAGLIATRREGRAVRHEVTPLGSLVASASSRASSAGSTGATQA